MQILNWRMSNISFLGMSTDEHGVERRKMTNTADLMRRGATLMNEPCPRCGGVQVRYKNKVYCTNEDDIDSILSPQLSQKTAPPANIEPIVQPVVEGIPTTDSIISRSPKPAENQQLRAILEEKLGVISKQLETSQDFEQQAKLLDLISRYLETLEKLKRASA